MERNNFTACLTRYVFHHCRWQPLGQDARQSCDLWPRFPAYPAELVDEGPYSRELAVVQCFTPPISATSTKSQQLKVLKNVLRLVDQRPVGLLA